MSKQNNRLFSFLSLGLLVSFLASACMDTSIPNEGTEDVPTTETTTEEGSPSSQTSEPIAPEETSLSEVSLVLNGDGFQIIRSEMDETESVTFEDSLGHCNRGSSCSVWTACDRGSSQPGLPCGSDGVH